MKVTTAVIFASGFGSRMLPVTAAVQKELLPILNRPVIDYVVSDCVAAGIKKIIFIIQPGSHSLQDLYAGNPGLESHLKRFKKYDAIKKLTSIRHQATFSFVEQTSNLGYGTAIPLLVAAPHLPKNEAFLVCGGDNFMWRTDGGSDLKDLVIAYEESGASGAMLALERPSDELHKYGVLKIHEKDEKTYLEKIVEKPEAGSAPSNIINISHYILEPALMSFVEGVKADAKSGEYYITDAVQSAAGANDFLVLKAKGSYIDAGSVAGWLEANITVAKSEPSLSHLVENISEKTMA